MSHLQQQRPVRPDRPERQPLLSVCTILILSGILLGIVIGDHIVGEMRTMVMAGGLVGLIAFIALDHVSGNRRESFEREEQEYVEQRLVKHVELSGEDALPNHDELLSLARQATECVELRDQQPATSNA